MQQWTRRCLHFEGRPYSPPKRARIRAFFADGVKRFRLAAAVELSPALVHVSVLLFYIGLIDFLININHTVAFVLLTCVATGCLIYFILTIMPLFYPNSPYQTPLSSLCWFVLEATILLMHRVSRRDEAAIYERQAEIGKGMRRALESKATRHVWADADTNALRWTLGFLDEDRELEEFLDGVPGLVHVYGFSRELKVRLGRLFEPVADQLLVTCTTGPLPEGLRRQRLMTCLRAIWCFSGTVNLHFLAIWDQWDKLTSDPWGPLSMETWAVASNMTTDSDPFIALRAHCIQALMAVMWSKGRWQCAPSEATSLLQSQLHAFSVDIDRSWHTNGNHLQLAVAANMLTNSLQLLPELDKLETGRDAMKIELKAILDSICGDLDASDLPHELRARFADRANVVEVFNIGDMASGSRTAFDLHGPWTKIFKPADVG